MLNWKALFSGKKQVIGVDAGSDSLKLVEILDTPKGPFLNKFAQVSLPKGVIVNGELAEPSILTEKLAWLSASCGCQGRPTVTALSGNSVMVKKVNFNQMDEGELRELLRDEGSKYLPFEDLSEVYLDFQVLKGSDVNPNQMEVLIVAAKKDLLDRYTGAFREAGHEVVIMDVDSYALETMYEENYEFEEEDAVALVNIGAATTSINVVKGGMSIFTRAFSLGGNIITEGIQRSRGVTFEEAEEIKTGGRANAEMDEDSPEDNLLIYAEPILQEIEGTLDYVKFQAREYVKQAIISGGSANITNLDKAIAERLHVETAIVNPFQKIDYNRKMLSPETMAKIGPIAAVGIGLALRRLGDR